jgi:hypothetical protein
LDAYDQVLRRIWLLYCLTNERDPRRVLYLTAETWDGIVTLAEAFGWFPVNDAILGTHFTAKIPLAGYYLDIPLSRAEDFGSERSLVVTEDALNLAEALERAFLAYEPSFMPVHYWFFSEREVEKNLPPAIGAIDAVINLSRLGSFWLSEFSQFPTGRV